MGVITLVSLDPQGLKENVVNMPTSLLQLYIASSLDSFIATPDGSVNWLDEFPVGELGYDAFYEKVGSIIIGRTTYEQVCGFGDWAFTDKQTIVLTRRPQPPTPVHPTVTFYSGDLVALCADLKAAATGNIWLMGGGKTVLSFLQAGLIDEIWLFLLPVLLGAGIPLFLDASRQIKLVCEGTEHFGNGVVLLRYGKS